MDTTLDIPGTRDMMQIISVVCDPMKLARRVPYRLGMKISDSTASPKALDIPAHPLASERREVPDFAEGTAQRPTPGGRLTLGAELGRGRAHVRLDATGGKAFATVIVLGALAALVVALCHVLH